ncbi:hypothetical protein, partial [Pseudoalteromonas sp. S408]|uniref:hypothetical protein n=1 Tax=Pseudoalteromonas sp. S408 TaxID=2066519 RepID=UPI0012775D2A
AAKEYVRASRLKAWEKYIAPIKEAADNAATLIRQMMVNDIDKYNALQQIANELQNNKEPQRRDVLRLLNIAIETAPDSPSAEDLRYYYKELLAANRALYNTHLHDQTPKSALLVNEVKPLISFDAPLV